eukprot:4289892-Amphidinium_carterae.2
MEDQPRQSRVVPSRRADKEECIPLHGGSTSAMEHPVVQHVRVADPHIGKSAGNAPKIECIVEENRWKGREDAGRQNEIRAMGETAVTRMDTTLNRNSIRTRVLHVARTRVLYTSSRQCCLDMILICFPCNSVPDDRSLKDISLVLCSWSDLCYALAVKLSNCLTTAMLHLRSRHHVLQGVLLFRKTKHHGEYLQLLSAQVQHDIGDMSGIVCAMPGYSCTCSVHRAE